MSTKNEKHAVYSSLVFQIAHYCLRPWPWIIIGLCVLVLYPNLPVEESRKGFIMIMRDFLPVGLKGLLLAGFLSAYMSTVSTQLNWGSSYLTNDLYKRFIRRKESFETAEAANKNYVAAGRIITILITLVSLLGTTQITMIDSAAQFLIASGAGLGMVLILRWYWWRINAWSELSATVAPILGLVIANYMLPRFLPNSFFIHHGGFVFTVVFTTIVWLIVTFVSPPTDKMVLKNFYERVKPGGWWKPFQKAGKKSKDISYLFISWIFAVVMVYAVLFFTGYLILKEWNLFFIWLGMFILSFGLLCWGMRMAFLLKLAPDFDSLKS